MSSAQPAKVKLPKKKKEVAKRPNKRNVKSSQTNQITNNNNYNNINNNNNNYNNNNNNLDIEHESMERYKLLKVLCMELAKPGTEPLEPTATGYTQQQLEQFLLNSTLKQILPASLIVASQSNAQVRLDCLTNS